jgi:hypothetical protein
MLIKRVFSSLRRIYQPSSLLLTFILFHSILIITYTIRQTLNQPGNITSLKRNILREPSQTAYNEIYLER